jgi:hypothetical protein
MQFEKVQLANSHIQLLTGRVDFPLIGEPLA